MTILLAWCAVFASNLFVPMLLGLRITEKGGRIGMASAVIVAFAVGCWICVRHRTIGVFFVIGGIAVGLSQMFPVLQVVAGLIGGVICQNARLMGALGTETSEFAGFFLTLITGGILMTLSAGSGFAIQRFVLDRWGNRRVKAGEDHERVDG
jgi:hypothetical protein